MIPRRIDRVYAPHIQLRAAAQLNPSGDNEVAIYENAGGILHHVSGEIVLLQMG